MKIVLVLFTIISVALIANALPILDEDNELLTRLGPGGVTPEQQKCIEDSVQEIKDANPQLDWWFADVEESTNDIVAKIKKCEAIQKPIDKKKCIIKVKILAKREWKRLVNLLPQDEKSIIGELKQAIAKCLKN